MAQGLGNGSQRTNHPNAVERSSPLEMTSGPILTIADDTYYAGYYTDNNGQRWYADIEGNVIRDILVDKSGQTVDSDGTPIEKVNGYWRPVDITR